MRNYKKYLAATLAAVMTLGTSVTAMAATTLATPSVSATPSDVTDKDSAGGILGGNGSVAGIVDKNVFHIVVPTIENDTTYYDFILDPQGLINKTGGVSLNGATYDNTSVRTLYFRNIPNGDDLAGSTYDYSNVSQGFQVTNKSTMDVDVTFTAEVKNLTEGITLAAKDDFTDDQNAATTDTSIYLGIIKDTDNAVAVADGGTPVSALLTKAPTTAYKEDWTEGGGFVYALDPAASVTFSSTVFKLTGASNPDGDWVTFKDKTVAPKLEVTWKVTEHFAPSPVPTIRVTEYTKPASGDLRMTVDLGQATEAATGITSVTFVNASGATKSLIADKDYTFADNTLTFKESFIAVMPANVSDYTVTFNDTAATKVVVKIR